MVFAAITKLVRQGGISIPTIMKKPAKSSVRISGERVSNPKGDKRMPKMKPIPNKATNTLAALVKCMCVSSFSCPSCPFTISDFVDSDYFFL